ncbi:hypothetical protein KQ304_09330 [Synechococcus sp. CS-1329]|uniref:hypothetical protein n=1 Tax=Synechococcus sp. CS-1329 TaxID=2847975 RepID=UPI00223B0BD3|nr:hypothetical protein [Synechococcus sp. CS-1329]MCT0219199.1 hypothetical protein [Synechococcus sp. CS-1329]
MESLSAAVDGPGPSDLLRRVAAAADLCMKPNRHAVVISSGAPELISAGPEAEPNEDECTLRLLCRRADGERAELNDIELEIYRSGEDLHLMLSWPEQTDQPMLWQGQHPVWMDGDSGQRCERPPAGAALEALARRLRALISPAQS